MAADILIPPIIKFGADLLGEVRCRVMMHPKV